MTGVQTPGAKPVRVFISYSHDSRQHRERVLAFANNLRAYGIDSVIDSYFEDTLDMRWADWMNEQIEAAAFVLLVATPGYAQRMKPGNSESPGRGGNFEGAIITQSLYNLHGRNTKFFAIYFSEQDRPSIPTLLEGFTSYNVSDNDGLTKLYRRLTNQPAVIPPPLGVITDPERLYAQPVELTVSTPRQQAVRERIEQLGQAYQNLRKSMPASNARTVKMEILSAKMRSMASDAYFMLDYLAKNPEPGYRLAAVSLLEVKPNQDYLEWLAERLAPEKPHVGYHAALALLASARVLAGEFRERTRRAIDDARSRLGPSLEKTDRAHALEEAARNLIETEAVVRQFSLTDQPLP